MNIQKRSVTVLPAPAAHWVGDGFPVRSMITPQGMGGKVSPFLLLDYAGPANFEPTEKPRGVEEHPHRGFETVTIVYQGELEHRDSTGNYGKIGAGDVQWMTAAAGVVHEEKHATDFARRGGVLEMVQLWVNLPAKYKMSTPRYQTILDKQIPVVELLNDAGYARVIAGEYSGKIGPARTFTPVTMIDIHLSSTGKSNWKFPLGYTTALLVLNGKVRVNFTHEAEHASLIIMEPDGEQFVIEAVEDSTLLLLSGEPILEPIASYGPFVMNTREELQQAFEDYQSGKMGTLSRQF